MARLTFKRLLLVGVAVAAGAAYAKRDQVRQLLPGGSQPSPTPEPYSPPPAAPSNYDVSGPPANTATPVPAPEPVVTPEPGRSEPVEEQAIQADDTAAVEDAIADAAAAAEAGGGITSPAGAPAGGVDTPAAGDPPSQLSPDAAGTAGAADVAPVADEPPQTETLPFDEPETASPAAETRAYSSPAAETQPHDVPSESTLESGEIEPLGMVEPEPIDEAAEEQAAAAEAANIGGSPGEQYAGSEPGVPATEAERPLAEAGEGVAEGQEQADAALEANAGPGDEGMSDAERQIDDTIEAADNPAVGETPDPATPPQEPKAQDDDDDISGGDWKTWSGGAVKPQ
jgi:hypothetical protein